jgi:extradiol dioxygenase family protein|tara:strand:- start:239 stop:664 length:426 start_codon:yes stop_codon:yes gene_type:complete
MAHTFHLAIPAGDLHNAIHFYCSVLGCTKGNSETNPPDSWCDINFWGNELTLHSSSCKQTSEGHNVDMGNVQVPHFGVHLTADEFKDLKEKIIQNNIKFVEEPFIRFQGNVLEQETMFIKDPNGNVLEIKTMVNPGELFNQ